MTLADRIRELLRANPEGMTTFELSHELDVSPDTIRTHLPLGIMWDGTTRPDGSILWRWVG
jgi:orotate phosphoribosyltransferase-like protein